MIWEHLKAKKHVSRSEAKLSMLDHPVQPVAASGNTPYNGESKDAHQNFQYSQWQHQVTLLTMVKSKDAHQDFQYSQWQHQVTLLTMVKSKDAHQDFQYSPWQRQVTLLTVMKSKDAHRDFFLDVIKMCLVLHYPATVDSRFCAFCFILLPKKELIQVE